MYGRLLSDVAVLALCLCTFVDARRSITRWIAGFVFGLWIVGFVAGYVTSTLHG